MIELFSIDDDKVIGGFFISGRVSYRYAIDNFYPLISRLEFQRDPINTRFYARLEKDIVSGCVMPPITIAFVDAGVNFRAVEEGMPFIEENMQDAFILDGIQRLNTLNRASQIEGFDGSRHLYVNYLITKSKDRLLYRMITLNNGQKAMSARHQIEVLADVFFEFEDVDVALIPEKGNKRVRVPGSFNKADFVKGYVAYLSGSTNIDNQKIIEEKMDELIAAKIIDSEIASSKMEFSDVVGVMTTFFDDKFLADWIRNSNNFIGFCVGAKSALDDVKGVAKSDLLESISRFERAFESLDVSKIKLGKVRRELVSKFIENYSEIGSLDEIEMLDKISEWV